MPAPASELHPDRARRAIGTIFLFAFGGAWLELYALGVFGMELCILAFIALVSVLLLFVAYRRYKQHQSALRAEAFSTQRQRAERVFNIVNASQWDVIFVVATVLSHLGLALDHPSHDFHCRSALPAACTRLRQSSTLRYWRCPDCSFRWYPLLAPNGATSPLGCVGAGLILWASALWAITANNSIKRRSLRSSG